MVRKSRVDRVLRVVTVVRKSRVDKGVEGGDSGEIKCLGVFKGDSSAPYVIYRQIKLLKIKIYIEFSFFHTRFIIYLNDLLTVIS